MDKHTHTILFLYGLGLVAGLAEHSGQDISSIPWADYYMPSKQKLHHKSKPQDPVTHSKQSQKRLIGRHVCTQNKVVMKPVQHMESYCKPTYQTYMRKCDHSSSTFCTGYRVVYELAYRVVEKMIAHTEISYACCPGWTQASWSHECKKALCSKECLNGGVCLKPNHCLCTPGWTGKQCEKGIISKESKASVSPRENPVVTPREIEELKRRLLRLEKNMVSLLEMKSRFENLHQVVSHHIAEKSSKDDRSPKQGGRKDSPSGGMRNDERHPGKDNRVETTEDRINSLSEQMAILEERLADCTCVHRDGIPSLPNAR